jgi:hypothetical protein
MFIRYCWILVDIHLYFDINSCEFHWRFIIVWIGTILIVLWIIINLKLIVWRWGKIIWTLKAGRKCQGMDILFRILIWWRNSLTGVSKQPLSGKFPLLCVKGNYFVDLHPKIVLSQLGRYLLTLSVLGHMAAIVLRPFSGNYTRSETHDV